MKKLILVICGFVVFILLLILNPVVFVGAGERGVVMRWGAVQDNVLIEGVHFINPISNKVKKLDVRTQKEQVEASAASKDLQIVKSTIALNYHLKEDKVNSLWQKIGGDYKERIIDPAIQEAIKSTTAKYTAEELITKRELVKNDAKQVLFDRLNGEYIAVDELSIVNFDFSNEFNKAIESKQTAVQDALKAENDLRRIKVEAEQRVAQATAEAQAIKIQAEAITQTGGQDYVNLKAVEKWSGVLPIYMTANAPLPFINVK